MGRSGRAVKVSGSYLVARMRNWQNEYMHDTRHSYTSGQIGARAVAYREQLRPTREDTHEVQEKIVTVGPGCEVNFKL